MIQSIGVTKLHVRSIKVSLDFILFQIIMLFFHPNFLCLARVLFSLHSGFWMTNVVRFIILEICMGKSSIISINMFDSRTSFFTDAFFAIYLTLLCSDSRIDVRFISAIWCTKSSRNLIRWRSTWILCDMQRRTKDIDMVYFFRNFRRIAFAIAIDTSLGIRCSRSRTVRRACLRM